MRQSTRLIVNTLITYARMAITVGMGLAVTRLGLDYLGESDYGLLATLGASGVFLLIVSDALTLSTQRHLAFEIGRGDHHTLRIVFNTALLVYAGVALVAIGVGLGVWPLLRMILDIPPGRETTAAWVYFLTLGNIVITVLATPYRGFLIAHQSFWAIAIYDLSQALLGFGAVLLLAEAEGDRLLLYAWLLIGVRLAAEGMTVLLAGLTYSDARPRPWLFRRSQVGRIASFAGWSMFTLVGWRLRVQGSTILLNSQYGSAASAAYGVASQLGGYQSQIGAAVWRTVRPAMTTIEAQGGAEGVRQLTLVSSKYLLLLTLFFLIPVQFEMEGVLGLWLKSTPQYTLGLTRLVLIWIALNWSSIGYQMAMEAKGTLGRYAIIMSTFDMGVLLVQVVALALVAKTAEGRPVVGPVIIPGITIALMAAQNVWRAWYVGRILGISLWRWVRGVLAPCAVVGTIGAVAALAPVLLMDAGPWRVLVTATAFGVAAAPATWFFGLDAWERDHFIRVARGAVGMARKYARRGRGGGGVEDSSAGTRGNPAATGQTTDGNAPPVGPDARLRQEPDPGATPIK